MTTLNFALTRTAARDVRAPATRSSSRGSTTTRTSRRGSSSRTTSASSSASSSIHDDTTLDLDDLERQLSDAHAGRRVPARRERGRHAHRRAADRRARARGRRARLGRRRALRRRTGRSTSRRSASTCSSARRTSSSARTSASRSRARELLESWRPYKVRPAPNEPLGHRFETGTLPHELLAGFVAAVEYVESIGWDAIQAHERALGERFLDGPARRLHAARPADDGRPRARPSPSRTTRARRARSRRRLGERGIAVWHGNYYALEVMQRLGLADGGAVRVGLRPLQHRRRGRPPAGGAIRLLILGGTKFLGRAAAEAALARGHEVTLVQPRADEPRPLPGAPRSCTATATATSTRSAGREWDAVVDTSGYVPARRPRRRPSCCATRPVLRLRLDDLRLRRPLRAADRGRRRLAERARRRRGVTGALRRAEGAVRARRRRSVRRPRAIVRPGLIVGPHDPDRPLHVLAAAHRARRRRPRARAAATSRCSSSTCATSAPGSCRSAERRARAAPSTRSTPPLTMARLLEACVRAVNPDARLVWVDERLPARARGRRVDGAAALGRRTPRWRGMHEADVARARGRASRSARSRRRCAARSRGGDDGRRRPEARARGGAAGGVGIVSIRRVTLRAPRARPLSRPRLDGPHEQRGLRDVRRAGADRVPLAARRATSQNMILARLEIDFRSPVELGETSRSASRRRASARRASTSTTCCAQGERARRRGEDRARRLRLRAAARSVEIPDEWRSGSPPDGASSNARPSTTACAS